MTRRHRRQDEPAVRLVHVQEEAERMGSIEGAGQWEPERAPMEPVEESDADNWTIRPKNRPPEDDLSAPEPAWRTSVHPVFVNSGPLATAVRLEDDGWSRRFLALGLAGIIYVIGIAGLWSMVQTFDQTTSPPLTPAGDRKAMPPLEGAIDLRDARLDEDRLVPKAKPEGAGSADEDIADSDLQKRI